MLIGWGFASAAFGCNALKNLQTLDGSIKDLLVQTYKELSKAADVLKVQMTADSRDPAKVLEAMGIVATVTMTLNQRLMQMQQIPPMGGGEHE